MGEAIKEYKMIFGYYWSWLTIIGLAGYCFIASAIVEITLQWRYCALITVIAALLSFLVVVWFRRWEKGLSKEVR